MEKNARFWRREKTAASGSLSSEPSTPEDLPDLSAMLVTINRPRVIRVGDIKLEIRRKPTGGAMQLVIVAPRDREIFFDSSEGFDG